MEEITLNYDESIEVVNATLDTIKYFEGLLKQKKNSLQDIEVIKSKLKQIISDLDNIKKYENHIIKINTEFSEDLAIKKESLKNVNIVNITKQKEQFITLMNHNLPDGIKLVESNMKDTWDIVFLENEFKPIEQILNPKKQSIDNAKVDKDIGEMVLTVSDKYLVIRVILKDDIIPQEFKIEDPLKVLPIINHIVNRHNYKEGIEIY